MSRPNTQVRSEPQPSDIRNLTQSSNTVNGAPKICKVAVQSQKCDDIHTRLDGTLRHEEERHPDQIEAQLDRVESHAVFGALDGFGGGQRRETNRDDTMSSISHDSREQIRNGSLTNAISMGSFPTYP